jgi:hypothetical protein
VDAERSAGLRPLTQGRPKRVAVAVIDRSVGPSTKFSFVNAHESTRFEIGSITKGLTGMLLADALLGLFPQRQRAAVILQSVAGRGAALARAMTELAERGGP